MRTHTRLSALMVFGGLAAPVGMPAQAPRPLDKIEIVRLLTNPLFAPSEVADVVRRSCVAFRPTERDWADLRNAGASGEVIASVADCTARPTEPPPAARALPPTAPAAGVAPLSAVAITSDVIVSIGTPSSARVFVHRGGAPQRRVPVTLRGSASIGLQRDAAGTTDDSGMAVLPLPPVMQQGVHRFEVVGANGATFSGRPIVTLTIRPGEPGRLRVSPEYIASAEFGATLVATVTDSFGNPLGRETVELTSGAAAPMSLLTDSLGRATFALASGSLPRGGALHVRVRKLAAVEVLVADAAGLAGASTGFVSPVSKRGRVGSPLSEDLIFRARTVQGAAPSGRIVRFRAVNARVQPDSATIDSTGRVSVHVQLGARSGEALVFASIDSVERMLALGVDPGPIATLVMEYNGRDVTGRAVSVPVAAPFVIRVSARDFYGNETSTDALTQILRTGAAQVAARQQDLEIVSIESVDSAVLITALARRMGMYNLTIGSGITARVRVDAVAR